MKTIIALFICFNSFGQILEVDKVAHMGIGYAAGTTTMLFLTAKQVQLHNAILISMGTGFVLGAAKEFYDKSKVNNFDVEDMFATGIGSMLGSFTVAIYFGEYKIKPLKKHRVQL
jgi:hypothetical protein